MPKKRFIISGLDVWAGVMSGFPVSVGEIKSFMPVMDLLYFEETEEVEPRLKKVFLNLYEFYFKPVAWYWRGYQLRVYDYVLDFGQDFLAYHWNPENVYDTYIQDDKTYWGYGLLDATTANPADMNPEVDIYMIDRIIITGTVKRIYLFKDDRNNHHLWSPSQIQQRIEEEGLKGKSEITTRLQLFKEWMRNKNFDIQQVDSIEDTERTETVLYEVEY